MFLVQLSIGVDPQDTRSWAAQVLPGVQPEHTIVIHGVGTTAGDYPLEVPPAADFTDDFEYINVLPEVLYTAPPIEKPADNQASPSPSPSPSPSIDEFEAEPIFFIYHSHPSESFLPELPGVSEVDRAYAKLSSGVTVTALGSRLREELTLLGLRSLHSDQDYPWEGAYQASRKTVKAAMAEHADLQFFIDIHRDAARKDKTTIDVNGVRYARFYLVVGQKNPQYKENLAFAQQLHRRIEDKMVGLSRGVVLKKAGSNGEFNQSLSPQSIVVEIGGVDNTLEEGFRSVAVLAEVLAEMYWEQGDAVEVMAPQKSQ
jgi:stage II sporulation protein P